MTAASPPAGVRNVRYRDGLMMAILAARAFRRGNLAQMRVGRHISKIDDIYVCSFTAAETKNRRELVEPLPAALTPYIDRCCEATFAMPSGSRPTGPR
jgi:hypothetical protein